MNLNKTVLLRDRKRHTDCRLSSTVLSWGVPYQGGTPSPDLLGGGTTGGSLLAEVPPDLTWLRGYPRQVPPAGVPPILTWLEGYPRWVPPWLGYYPILTWLGGALGGYPLAGVPLVLTWLGDTLGGHPPGWGIP